MGRPEHLAGPWPADLARAVAWPGAGSPAERRRQPGRRRVERRERANQRVLVPAAPELPDPLVRERPGAARRAGAVTMALIAGAVTHFVVLGAFVAANALARVLDTPPPPVEEPELALLAEPGEQPPPAPPPEPDDPPLPADPLEPAVAPAPSPIEPAPAIGISAESTVEGGGGPAFRTGLSLDGAAPPAGLAQEILSREARAVAPAEEMVMTGDTVDTPARPAPSNRPPAMPARARQTRTSGFVVVQLLVGKDGAVLESRIARAEPAGVFEEAVLEVVTGWRFTPGTYRGQPVVMRVDQKIRFDVR